MNAPWLALLDRALDGDTLTDAEHHALAAALRDQDNAGRAGEWLCFEAALRARLSPTSGDALSLARERLLAKAALREKRQQVAAAAPRAARRWPLVAIAAAAVLAIAAGAWLSLRDGYRQPQAEGQFEVVRNGNALGQTSSLRRGDVVRAGVAGARIHLGGYCELEAVQGAQLVIRGEPDREAVKLLAGRLVSRITPGKGQYRVFTPLGDVEVKGTEFVTDVMDLPPRTGEKDMGKLKKATLVSIMVLSGSVAYQFGDVAGVLNVGMSEAFAGEDGKMWRTPEALHGFKGILEGVILSKGHDSFVLRIEKIKREWKQSRSEHAERAVGKTAKVLVRERSRLLEQHLRTLRRLRTRDRVEVEVFHHDNVLLVVEMLRKLEEPREGRDRERGEREGGDQDPEHEGRDGDRGREHREHEGGDRDRDREHHEREGGDRDRDGKHREREGDGEHREHEGGERKREGDREHEGDREREGGERKREGEGEERTKFQRAPEGTAGFKGILAGRLVRKGDVSFVVNVDRVVKLFETNAAKRPAGLVGTQVQFTLRWKGRFNERLAKALRDIKVGDRIEVGAFHLEGNVFAAVEMLRKEAEF